MKKLMMLGGLFGFAIGLGFGLAYGSSWPSVLWRASVATLCAGWLIRWWGGVWARALRDGLSGDLSTESLLPESHSLKR